MLMYQWYIITNNMLKTNANTVRDTMKINIEFIVMNSENITKYLDLYNYNISALC